MKHIVRIISILALLSAPLLARIGETTDECIRRYGEPLGIAPDKSRITFRKNGYDIFCYFLKDGKCWRILYEATFTPQTRPVSVLASKEWTEEYRRLMDLNGTGWQMDFKLTNGERLVYTNGKLRAVVISIIRRTAGIGTVIVQNAELANQEAIAAADAEDAARRKEVDRRTGGL